MRPRRGLSRHPNFSCQAQQGLETSVGARAGSRLHERGILEAGALLIGFTDCGSHHPYQGILTLIRNPHFPTRPSPTISVWEVRLPLPLDAIYAAREQIHTLVLPLQDHYGVLILASVVPLTLCAG
jgi:hypothetical protein